MKKPFQLSRLTETKIFCFLKDTVKKGKRLVTDTVFGERCEKSQLSKIHKIQKLPLKMQEDNNNKNLTWRNGHRLYQKKLQRSTATNQEYEELSRKVTV